MVRLCFALLLLYKEQDGIHMPRRLMDDLKGEVIDEKLHECALGHDILSADLNGEDATAFIRRASCFLSREVPWLSIFGFVRLCSRCS